ncbi:MAG TPA: glycosyltransferase family A protein [Candidatus Acidoferrum sp.]|nr:glycosyltransferase family A protein [Candidatus Acidoferrum sp.]
MKTPAFTVLIDTYNHERFIEEAIQSVLQQDFPASEMEILVVDDGSTDRTPEIVRKFEPQLRLIRKQNGGQASAFNAGIPEARGQFLSFLDGDDWWSPRKISAVADAFEKHPNVGIVGHGILKWTRGTQEKVSAALPDPMIVDSVEVASVFRLYRSYFGTTQVSMKTALAKSVLPIPEALVFEADEYLSTMTATSAQFVVLPDLLSNYRIHGANLYFLAGASRAGLRRKQQVIAALAAVLQRDLIGRGVATDVVDCLVEIVDAEATQLRLMLDGGAPWDTIRTENRIYRILHSHATAKQKLYHDLAFLPACFLPPKWFYAARGWITSRGWYTRARKSVLPIPGISTTDGTEHVHD